MRHHNAVVGLALAVSACSAATTPPQPGTLAAYQADVEAACHLAMRLAPLAPSIQPWIVGACRTEAAIAKLALDPTGLAWLNGLILRIKP